MLLFLFIIVGVTILRAAELNPLQVAYTENDYEAMLNFLTFDYKSTFYKACSQANLEVIQLFLWSDKLTSEMLLKGLIEAVLTDNVQVLNLLANDKRSRKKHIRHAFECACEQGKVRVIRALLFDHRSGAKRHDNIIFFPVDTRNAEALRAILESGMTDQDRREDALVRAASSYTGKSSEAIVKAILESEISACGIKRALRACLKPKNSGCSGLFRMLLEDGRTRLTGYNYQEILLKTIECGSPDLPRLLLDWSREHDVSMAHQLDGIEGALLQADCPLILEVLLCNLSKVIQHSERSERPFPLLISEFASIYKVYRTLALVLHQTDYMLPRELVRSLLARLLQAFLELRELLKVKEKTKQL